MAPDAEQRRPLDFVELVRGAHRLEQARQHADSDAEALDDPDRVEQAVVVVAASRGDQGAVDVVLGEQVLEGVEVAQQGQSVGAGVVELSGTRPTTVAWCRGSAPASLASQCGRFRVAEDQAALLVHDRAGRRAGEPRNSSIETKRSPQRTTAWRARRWPSTIASPARKASSV